MSASLMISGLSDKLAMSPARQSLFARDSILAYVGGVESNVQSKGAWHTLSFSTPFPAEVSAIGIQLHTGGDASDWKDADLYLDTVEIR